MRSSNRNMLLRGLAVLALAAPLLAGGNDSSLTEPKVAATPTLSGSLLEITMFNETGETTGQLHLHR
jgi:hypothetical protein